MPPPALQIKTARSNCWLARYPNDTGPYAKYYLLSYGNPPILTRKRHGHSEWDNGRILLSPSEFASMFHGIRLRPGEGPIKVQLSAYLAA